LHFLLKIGLTAAAFLSYGQPAFAQTDPSSMVPPRRITDGRGVDLHSGQLLVNISLASFGGNATALSAWLEVSPGAPAAGAAFQNTAGNMMASAIRPQANITGGDSGDEFGPYQNIVFPNGAGFIRSPSTAYGALAYHTNADGSRYYQSFGTSHFTTFTSNDPNLAGVFNAAGDRGVIDPASPYLSTFQTITLASGEEWRFYWERGTVPCSVPWPQICQFPTVPIGRLRFLTSSRGYGIQFLYVSDATPASNSTAGTWNAPRRVTAYNKAVSYCNEALLQECTAVTALPSSVITYNSTNGTILITPPGSSDGTELAAPLSMRQTAVPNSTVSLQVAIDNAGFGYVSRVTDADGQWNYTHITYTDDSGHIPTTYATSTNPAGSEVSAYGYGYFGTIGTYVDELNRFYNWGDGFPFRDNGRQEPEGDETAIGRDERNNITSLVRYPKPNSGLPPLTLYTATYPVDCTNPRTCNHPITATDANNNVWSYTYAPEHGGVLTETGPPAPTRQSDGSIANVQPQKRYEYAQRYASISNGSGGYMHGPTAIWLMTRERHCVATAASGSSCAGGAADEVVTDYDYGPDSGPNTLLLRGVAVTAYVSGAPVTNRTCYGYDSAGNRISETQPNALLTSCP
jgi:hypothetical protein